MTAAWNFVLHVLNTLPAWLAALLVGWAISVGLTQSLKFAIPVHFCEDWRELISRLVAFMSAAFPAGLYYLTDPTAAPAVAFLVMLAAGVWSPLAFAILQWALRTNAKTAGLADVLSGDTRGVLKAKLGKSDAR